MKPAIEIAGARVFLGDCVEVMRSLPDNSVDSVVTDPPYGLEFMGKEWDSFKAKKDAEVPGVQSGQTKFWSSDESSGIGVGGPRFGTQTRADRLAFQEFNYAWAVECLRVLKPGGHLVAFGGTRMWHRLAVAVEDAGFELRDSIAWIYGSGFPKSLDVSKAIDKSAGVEREREEPQSRKQPSSSISATGFGADGWSPQVKNPITPEAKEWQGWGTALKPAFEPVVVGRKPLVGTVAENVLMWGVGGLNIDGSRIGSETLPAQGRGNSVNTDFMSGGNTPERQGRWPANVILDEVSAGLLDEQSGNVKSGIAVTRNGGGRRIFNKESSGVVVPDSGYRDSGGASRFFYVAKASKRDRNEGLDGLGARANRINAPRESEEQKHSTSKQNFHPTVKPTQLMRYLIKLVTPEGGVVLDPFTGSGSTGKAALLDGYQFIGAELTEEYLPIIEGRLKWASEQEGETDDTLF